MEDDLRKMDEERDKESGESVGFEKRETTNGGNSVYFRGQFEIGVKNRTSEGGITSTGDIGT